MLVYSKDELRVSRYRRFAAKDPDLLAVHSQWETALRKAVQEFPTVRFFEPGPRALSGIEEGRWPILRDRPSTIDHRP